MPTHSSILAWRIPQTEKPGGLQSIGPHRVGHDWSDSACTPVVRIPWFLCRGCEFHSLVGKLRSCKLYSAAKKSNKIKLSSNPPPATYSLYDLHKSLNGSVPHCLICNLGIVITTRKTAGGLNKIMHVKCMGYCSWTRISCLFLDIFQVFIVWIHSRDPDKMWTRMQGKSEVFQNFSAPPKPF